MQTEVKISPEDVRNLIKDVALIKNTLLNEGELTDWAKKELSNARKRKTKISHEEVKRRILGK